MGIQFEPEPYGSTDSQFLSAIKDNAKKLGFEQITLTHNTDPPGIAVTLHNAAGGNTYAYTLPIPVMDIPPLPKVHNADSWASLWTSSTFQPFKQLPTPVEPPKPPKPQPAAVAPLPTISQPASDLFDYDEHGYAKPAGPFGALPDYAKQLTIRIGEIARAFGNGKIIARGRSTMPKNAKQLWLTSWYAGDLRTCFLLEQQQGVTVSPRHPGHPDNPATHRIVWAPAVAGELPAGILPDGDWPSPETHPSHAVCGNYLLAAHMAHSVHLDGYRRRVWVQAHMRGDKHLVDELSVNAKTRADAGLSGSFPEPVWSPGAFAKTESYDTHLSIDLTTTLWPVGALKAYATDHHLDHTGAWPSLVAAVQAHRADAAVKAAASACKLHLTTAATQPALRGYHPKSVLVDHHGRRWLFKPARDDAHRYRPEIEHAAHRLARLWGYPTAESHLVDHDGAYGQIQLMFTEAGHLGGYTATQLAGIHPDRLTALACEHLLDWALDNDDSHGENIILTADGQLVGIDKARAFCYFGAWDGLSGHDSANSNAPLVYTELYKAIKTHLIGRDTADRMYRAVLARARRMARVPDDQVADILHAGLANRPHYRAPSYRQPHPGAPGNADELVAAALTRKNRLPDDMQGLWERIYDAAGWQLPDPTIGVLGENPQGHLMHSGLHTPELHEAVTRTKSYGTPAFVAGTDIEDAHILLWRERCEGVYRVRGQFKIRPGATYTTVKKWCHDHAVNVDGPVVDAPKELPGETGYYAAIINAAKSVSFHAGDGQHNQDKLTTLTLIKKYLEIGRDAARTALTKGAADPWGTHAATIEMADLYLGYIAAVEAHKAARTASQEGDFPRYVYTPTPPPAPPAPDPPQVRVERVRATRAAATDGPNPVLAADGELDLTPGLLLRRNLGAHNGQHGTMYLTTLPTGEQIEFRANTDTSTPLTSQGLVQFTIPDAATAAESLHRIDDQLTAMGVTIHDADLTDLELFYWRHLHGVLSGRCDSKLTNHPHQNPRYKAFWDALNIPATAGRDAEVTAWRTAFAALTSPEQIAQFLAADAHLPRFMHMDLRNPGQPCGKPYWERFDVPAPKWQSKQMPTLSYRTGPRNIITTGVAMASEARTRTFAIWKAGMSSSEDYGYGSGAFIFTRNRQENSDEANANVYFSPRIAARTTSYAFPADKYGRIEERSTSAPFDFDRMTGFDDPSNEMMVKDAVSLLDDIEILVFETDTLRATAIAALAELGITSIRGVPATVRFIVRGDKVAKAKAISAARESFQHGQHGMAGPAK